MESEKERETEIYWMKKSEMLLLKKEPVVLDVFRKWAKAKIFFQNRLSHRCVYTVSLHLPPQPSGWPNHCVASGLFFRISLVNSERLFEAEHILSQILYVNNSVK